MDAMQKADLLVERDVIYCVSELIWELRRVHETLSDYDEYVNLVSGRADYESAAQAEGWFEHEGRIIKKDEAWDSDVIDTLKTLGYRVDENDTGETYHLYSNDGLVFGGEGDEDDAWSEFERQFPAAWAQAKLQYEMENAEEAESWEEACRLDSVDPDYDEAMEHWIVSNWLGEKLIEKGEVVESFLGMTIWARCTSGQSITLDYVIQEIAKERL